MKTVPVSAGYLVAAVAAVAAASSVCSPCHGWSTTTLASRPSTAAFAVADRPGRTDESHHGTSFGLSELNHQTLSSRRISKPLLSSASTSPKPSSSSPSSPSMAHTRSIVPGRPSKVSAESPSKLPMTATAAFDTAPSSRTRPAVPSVRKTLQSAADAIETIRRVFNRGTAIHTFNGIAAATIVCAITASRRFQPPSLSHAVMILAFSMLIYDNAALAAGRFIGPGKQLRAMTRVRLIGHGIVAPLQCVPTVRAAMFHGIVGATASKLLIGSALLCSIIEVAFWTKFDTDKLQLVDNRDTDRHSTRYLAGTLAYTSGKVLRCVLPVVLQSTASVVAGGMLWKRFGCTAGALICMSGLTAFVSCSMQRADVQSIGEPISMGLMWASVLALPP